MSSALAAASLILKPEGYSEGTLESLKPIDRSGDFTFTRGSNLSATRVNSAGLIEKGRENLLLQSNQFNTTWTISEGTILGGQSGYDGSSDAWLYTDNVGTTSKSHDVRQSVSESGVNCFSIYAKMGTKAWVKMYDGLNTCYFNIDPNYVGSRVGVNATLGGRAEDVGNGWFRLSVFNNGSTSLVLFGIAGGNGTGNYTSDGTGTVYIQDAQLEVGMVATDYIETGASTVKAGILENTPRLDYSGGATEPSLLLEPSRTNLIGQSEYFDSWNKISSPTITNNYGTSPEGVQNSTLFETTSASGRITYDVFTINANEVFSVYMKGSGSIRVQVGSDVFNPSITSGWVRYEFKTTQVGSNGTIQIRDTDSGLDASVELYGAQYERNSYATSYIPTYGSSVTRSAESFEKTGLSSVIGQTEGTIFFEFEYSHQQINTPFFRVLENSSNLYEIIALSSFKLRSRARIGNSIVAAIDTASVVTEGTHKAAIIYKSGDYKFYLDGSLVGSSTENSIVSNPSEINYFDNNNNLEQFLIFPTALSDADCITLTTL